MCVCGVSGECVRVSVCVLCNIFARPFLCFCFRTFFDFLNYFLILIAFLSDLSCSPSEIKFVALIKVTVGEKRSAQL